jgi:hypothetical protein
MQGQICMFRVSLNIMPLAVKKSDLRLDYTTRVVQSKPMVEPRIAPVVAQFAVVCICASLISYFCTYIYSVREGSC